MIKVCWSIYLCFHISLDSEEDITDSNNTSKEQELQEQFLHPPRRYVWLLEELLILNSGMNNAWEATEKEPLERKIGIPVKSAEILLEGKGSGAVNNCTLFSTSHQGYYY